jgi:hypothetical protein
MSLKDSENQDETNTDDAKQPVVRESNNKCVSSGMLEETSYRDASDWDVSPYGSDDSFLLH